MLYQTLYINLYQENSNKTWNIQATILSNYLEAAAWTSIIEH